MKSFTILNGPQAGMTFELEGDRMVVGREEGQGLVLQDDRVSRCHIALERRGDGVAAIDMGSSNGTFINDKMAFEQELREGDVLTVGRTQIRYGEARSAVGFTGLEDATPQTVPAAAGGEETFFVDQPSDPSGATVVGQTNPNSATVVGGVAGDGATTPESATVVGGVAADGPTNPDGATLIGAAATGPISRPDSPTVVGGSDAGGTAAPASPHPETPPGDWERVVPATYASVAEVAEFMRECAAAAGLPEDAAGKLDLAARQVSALLFRQLSTGPLTDLTLRCREERGGMRVEFRYAGPDDGAADGASPGPKTSADPTLMLGPLGVDEMDSRREGGVNVLTIFKRIAPSA